MSPYIPRRHITALFTAHGIHPQHSIDPSTWIPVWDAVKHSEIMGVNQAVSSDVQEATS